MSDQHLLPADADRALYWVRALGRERLPLTLDLDSRRYFLVETLKHDFFAATGLYRAETGERVVLKTNRTTACAGIPLKWLGRLLRDREARFYRRLADVPNIPKLLRLAGETSLIHAYVPAHALSSCAAIPNGFFDRLLALMRVLHERDLAYVDSHKTQNILVGEDGEPYLVDFQISADLTMGDTAVTRWLLRQLQWTDRYHVLKHKSRLRPDELRADEARIVREKSRFIRIHRVYTTPYQKMLERVFRRWERSGRVAPNGIE